MLVLTRKLQQQIKIGEQITVTILRVKGNTVRVGIQAPREVRVVRGELPKDVAADAEANINADANVTAESLVVSGEGGVDSAVVIEETADSAVRDLSESGFSVPPAAHLPLRRIRNRHGAAPLKQLIASCATLAK
jgi:carbon storage regulator